MSLELTTANDEQLALIRAALKVLGLEGGTLDAGGKITLPDGSYFGEGSRTVGEGVKGAARVCAIGYEEVWRNGSRYVHDNSGLVRETTNQFIAPSTSDDETLGYQVGSRWITDDQKQYVCESNVEGAAKWESEAETLPNPGGAYIVLQEALEANNAGRIPERALRKVLITIDSELSLPSGGELGQRITYLVYNNTGGTLQLTLGGANRTLPDGLAWNPNLQEWRERRVTIEHNGWGWNVLPTQDFYWD